MPSHLHESLVFLVRENPRLVEHLLRAVLGVELEGEVVPRPSAETLSEVQPAEYRADVVFELRPW